MAIIWLAQISNPGNEIGSINSDIVAYLKLIAVLAIILIGAVVALRFGLPRITGARKLSPGLIRVTAHYPLEPRKNLYIVQAGREYFLVGTSESGLHYLTALDSQSVDTPTAEQESTAATSGEFVSLMKTFKRPRRSP